MNKESPISERRTNSVFNNVSFNTEKDKLVIGRVINSYSRNVVNQLKYMEIRDSDIKKYTNKYNRTKPLSFNFLMEGMRRIIFNSDGLIRQTKPEKAVKNKPRKIEDEAKLKRKTLHKFKVVNIRPKSPEKREPGFFITNFEAAKIRPKSKHTNYNNSDSTARSTRMLQIPSLKLENNFDDEKDEFLKKFSRNKFKRKCSEIYNDNISILKQLNQDLSNSTARKYELRMTNYEIDKNIFGNLDKRIESPGMVKNRSTGMLEYMNKPKANLIKFGESVNKMNDNLIVGYKGYLEGTYSTFAKDAHVEDLEGSNVKLNRFNKVKRNSVQMHILEKNILSKRNSMFGVK